MKSVIVLLPIAATVVAKTQLEISSEDPVSGTDTVHGCYSSLGELKLNGTYAFNTQGLCASSCRAAGAYVAASQGEECYCGDKYPASNTLVDDSECNEPCPGYTMQACGGADTFTVYNTGVKVDVDESTDVDDSSSSKVSTATSSVNGASTYTSAGSVVTVSPTTTIVAATGTSSNGTASTTNASSAVTSGTASASSTTTAVSTNGAASQFSLNGLGIAILSLGTMFLL